MRYRPEIKIVEWDLHDAPPAVVVVVFDAVDDALPLLRQIHRTSTARGILVTTRVDEQQLANAAECGVKGIVRRSEATPERLVEVIGSVVRNEGWVPPDLLGSLLEQVGRLQAKAPAYQRLFAKFSDRETEILRLLSEGVETAEIAAKLSYCERTIKSDLTSVMTRFQLRNRVHAVAYALRQGLI